MNTSSNLKKEYKGLDMSNLPVNGAPEVYFLGTKDDSTKQLPYIPPERATHIPYFILFTEKGPVGKKNYVGSNVSAIYGEATFDPKSPYFNNANLLADKLLGLGNPLVIQRVLPEEAMNKIANVTIYLDVLPVKLPIYKRYEDGSYILDSNGEPLQDGNRTIPGYKVKLIAEYDPTMHPSTPLGLKNPKQGTMKDSNGNPSTMTPIIEYKAKYQGEYYNKIGFAYELKTSDEIPDGFIEGLLALPYNLYMYKKGNDGTSHIVPNIDGAKHATFVFKPNAKDPNTDLAIELKDATAEWFNETNQYLPYIPWDIEEPYVYTNNLEKLLNSFIESEKPFINANVPAVTSSGESITVNTYSWFDFLPDVDLSKQTYLINPFNGYSTKRVPYYTIVVEKEPSDLQPTQEEAYFSINLPIYLNGGTDGDLSFGELEKQIYNIMQEYSDPNSLYQNIALNPENIFYDVGYSLELKKALTNFIKLRKDTMLVLSTASLLGNPNPNLIGAPTQRKIIPNDVATDRAIAINLKTMLNLAPESTYFGTGVARAIIVMGCGKLVNWLDNDYYPLTFDIAVKSAKMMAGPVWKRDELFDRGGRNAIKDMYDIHPIAIPQGVKPALWNAGLVYPDNSDINQWFFPALQTVYDNDTSVLNSYFTTLALTVINKVAFRLWVEYTGNIELTPAQLLDALRNRANEELKGKFADIIKVVPDPVITNYDKATGYSWTMRFKLYANVPTTVMRTYTVAFRKSDYPGK